MVILYKPYESVDGDCQSREVDPESAALLLFCTLAAMIYPKPKAVWNKWT